MLKCRGTDSQQGQHLPHESSCHHGAPRTTLSPPQTPAGIWDSGRLPGSASTRHAYLSRKGAAPGSLQPWKEERALNWHRPPAEQRLQRWHRHNSTATRSIPHTARGPGSQPTVTWVPTGLTYLIVPSDIRGLCLSEQVQGSSTPGSPLDGLLSGGSQAPSTSTAVTQPPTSRPQGLSMQEGNAGL